MSYSKKIEKIYRCSIEFSSVTRGLWSKEVSRVSIKAVEKGEKNKRWGNNLRQTYERFSDSSAKSAFSRIGTEV